MKNLIPKKIRVFVLSLTEPKKGGNLKKEREKEMNRQFGTLKREKLKGN